MNKLSHTLTAVTLLSSLALIGCDTTGSNSLFSSSPRDNQAMSNNYSGGSYSRGVSVPNSYHFSETASPKKHTARDANWVEQQNPNAYTIELATDAKPAPVAKVLHETPKQERTAQIKRKQDGETVYTGVYGTYDSRESAEKAMSNLPPEVRDKANVQSWDNIQRSTVQPEPSRVAPPSTRTTTPSTRDSSTRFDPLQNLDM